MNIRMSMLSALGVSAMCAALAGCIDLPQTKALITPVGVVGVHSFAPRATDSNQLAPPDFRQRLAQQAAAQAAAKEPPG